MVQEQGPQPNQTPEEEVAAQTESDTPRRKATSWRPYIPFLIAMNAGAIFFAAHYIREYYQLEIEASQLRDEQLQILEQGYNNLFLELEDLLGKTHQKPIDPNILNSLEKEQPEPIAISLEFDRFQSRQYQLNGAFYELAIRPNTQPAVETLEQIASEHLTMGLQMLNQSEGKKIAEYLGENKIKIGDRIYDLQNPSDFQIAYAIAYLRFESLVQEEERKFLKDANMPGLNIRVGDKNYNLKIPEESLTQNRDGALAWLKDENVAINFAPNSVLFVEPGSLATFAGILKLTRDLGFPIPRINVLGPNSEAGGRYIQHGLVSRDSIIDYADEYGSVDSLVHEVGHYIATNASETNNPKLSQDAFNEAMEKVEKDHLPNVSNKMALFYWLPDTEKIRETLKSREEQYAYVFTHFVLEGGWFKNGVESEQLRQTRPSHAAILDAWYKFFKDGLGREFTQDTLTEQELAIP